MLSPNHFEAEILLNSSFHQFLFYGLYGKLNRFGAQMERCVTRRPHEKRKILVHAQTTRLFFAVCFFPVHISVCLSIDV